MTIRVTAHSPNPETGRPDSWHATCMDIRTVTTNPENGMNFRMSEPVARTIAEALSVAALQYEIDAQTQANDGAPVRIVNAFKAQAAEARRIADSLTCAAPDIYAGVTSDELRVDVREMQNIQKCNLSTSNAWKAASRYLNACAAELARRGEST